MAFARPQVAEALMAASVPPGSCAARIMLFTGGPCTEGSGKIINKNLEEEIRRCAGQYLLYSQLCLLCQHWGTVMLMLKQCWHMLAAAGAHA